MNFEDYCTYMYSIRSGCANKLLHMSGDESVEEYNYYTERYNRLSGTVMSLQSEYYDNE